MTEQESDTLRIEWDEIESIVENVFRVWGSGSDLLLARHAWAELAAAGKTYYETDLGRSVAIVQLLAFGAYYREFCVYGFDEGSAGGWREWITSDLIGNRPLLDGAILGEPVAQPDMPEDDFLDDAHAVSEILQDVVKDECRSVISMLKERWGDARFFASLFATATWDFDGAYPLTDEAVDEIVNDNVTGSKLQAWSWVDTDGSLW
jgi:hypothetical protein